MSKASISPSNISGLLPSNAPPAMKTSPKKLVSVYQNKSRWKNNMEHAIFQLNAKIAIENVSSPFCQPHLIKLNRMKMDW